MKSKAVVFACLLFVSVVVIASAVSEGTDDQEQHRQKLAEVENGNSVEESKTRCLHGCCQFFRGDCAKCCRSPTEAAAALQVQATNQNEGESEVETNGLIGGGKGGKVNMEPLI